MPYRVTLFDWLLLSTLVVLWGSSFVMSKIALAEIDPAWVAASRLFVGAVILFVFGILRGERLSTSQTALKQYGWLGFIGNALPFFLITWGIQFVTSGVAGLLMGTIPLIVIAMAHFYLPNERLTPRKLAGFALGFIGILVLMGPSALKGFSFNGKELIGQLAIIAGCVCYGVNSISTKRFGMQGSIINVAGVLLAGAFMSIIPAYFYAPFDLFEKSSAALWAILGLGLFPTGIATAVWFKGVERTSPTFISMSNYLVPIYALIFGAILLDEVIAPTVIIALMLVLTGIYVSRTNGKIKPQP